MVTSKALRFGGLLALGLFMTACDGGVEIEFAQPFPTKGVDIAVFPARHRGVYTAADSSKSLCIGATAVWRQELHSFIFSRYQLDSLHHRLMADSTYQENGHLHYLRLVSRDSVRDSWLWNDTIFNLAGNEAGMLRRFQGRYYLNTPDETGTKWWVQRLEISGHHLRWQTLATDTLRLLALDTAIVRHHREKGISYYRLTPAPGPQTRHLGLCTELWETAGEYGRRR